MVRTTYDLKGRAAIVTGASSGIGVGIATELAAVGARVVAVGRNVARLEGLATTIRGAGGEIAVVEADISTQSGIEAIINGAVAAFGGIDSIVHSAGIFYPKSFDETTSEDFVDQFNINVMAPFNLTKAALPHLSKGGSVIFISSTAARVGFANTGAYSATKAAVDALTRVMAIELAPKGIRVNGVAPGWIATPMNEDLREDKTVVDAAIAAIPAGRLGTPEDIAPAVVFLASDAAKYVLGVTLDVGGGYPSLPDVIRRD